jgi:DNA adenine methylase
LTPWAREEYELSLQPCDDEVERARRFFMGNMLSISGNPCASGLRICTDATDARDRISTVIDALQSTAERLLSTPTSMVQIENDTYQRMITRFDGANTLIYFDPPYVHSERTSTKEYAFEWANEEHETAADLLRQCAGYVVVSGYACDLYTVLYEAHGWHRVDKEAQTNSGGKRIESLWLSPRTWKAIRNDHSDLPMFA